MNSYLIYALLGMLLVLNVRADCDDTKAPDDSDFTHFFKNLGCKVKQGAEDVAEAAKPYATKINEGAKDIGSRLAQKYDDIKHHLSDDSSDKPQVTPVVYDAPTEKVPLAPIGGPQPPLPSVASSPAA
ncbi:uncharacterized protein [Drosophila tropicalis]|uniref:uncharacterized protein n=1 Tax=Drosophila tropicalis TaxID=46794 RepID=UPI0035ABE83D